MGLQKMTSFTRPIMDLSAGANDLQISKIVTDEKLTKPDLEEDYNSSDLDSN